jgi:hypothetical protein
MKIYIEINNFNVNLNKEEIEKILSSIDNIKHKKKKNKLYKNNPKRRSYLIVERVSKKEALIRAKNEI